MAFVAMANATPGSLASSSEYNKVVANVNQLNTTRTKYKKAACTTNAVLTTTATDLPGATISFTTVEPNTQVLVIGVFDMDQSTGTDIGIGSCVVDGVAQSGAANFYGGRSCNTQSWLVNIVSAGVHTAKLQVAKAGATGLMTCYSLHSGITIEGQGIV